MQISHQNPNSVVAKSMTLSKYLTDKIHFGITYKPVIDVVIKIIS